MENKKWLRASIAGLGVALALALTPTATFADVAADATADISITGLEEVPEGATSSGVAAIG